MDDPSYAYEESVARNATLVAYIGGIFYSPARVTGPSTDSFGYISWCRYGVHTSIFISESSLKDIQTVSSAHGLYIALVNNPDVQRRAQEELDTVIGKCRLPKPSDIPRLPYIRAIVKELSRWFNVIPLGEPKRFEYLCD
jgi:hypothetical protein